MKIYVGNIPFNMNDTELADLFGEFGEVKSANVISDRETGRPRGFGFVEMGDDEARKAIDELVDREVGGRRLKVSEARPRRNRGPRSGGGGGRRW